MRSQQNMKRRQKRDMLNVARLLCLKTLLKGTLNLLLKSLWNGKFRCSVPFRYNGMENGTNFGSVRYNGTETEHAISVPFRPKHVFSMYFSCISVVPFRSVITETEMEQILVPSIITERKRNTPFPFRSVPLTPLPLRVKTPVSFFVSDSGSQQRPSSTVGFCFKICAIKISRTADPHHFSPVLQ